MDTLLRKVSRLVEQITGGAPGGTQASAARQLPVIKVLVLGASGVGKSTIIRTYCDGRKQAGKALASTAEIETTRVSLEQREKKWQPLTAEYALRSGRVQAPGKGYWKKGEGLRFELQLCEVPMSELHDEMGAVRREFAAAHACIFVVDGMRPLTVRGAMRWAAQCDAMWEGREVPRVLALHKIDAGRSLIPREALEGLVATCGSKRFERTSTVGVSVADMVHRLLDDVLELELLRLGTDSCEVDWLVGHREPLQPPQRQMSGDEYPSDEAAVAMPSGEQLGGGARGENEGVGGDDGRHPFMRAQSAGIAEMYFVNEKKPTSMSSAEESDMEAWGSSATSPDSKSEPQLSVMREQRRDLKRIMKSISKYYDSLRAQLEKIQQQTGEERTSEFDLHASRRRKEHEQLLRLIDLCSRSSDDSSGSSSSGVAAEAEEAASFDELTEQLVKNQRKWSRLLEAYETELLLARAAPPPASRRSLSPADARVPDRRVSTAAVGERGRTSPGKGFAFRQVGGSGQATAPVPLVNNGSAPLILRTRCESY